MASLVLNSGSQQPESLITTTGGAPCEYLLKQRRCRQRSNFTKSGATQDKKVGRIQEYEYNIMQFKRLECINGEQVENYFCMFFFVLR
jgi:hypothetical protein